MARKVHLIGICGTAMATLAALLKSRGDEVQGSDEHVYPPMSGFLAGEGIPILEGYDAAHIADDIDLVVIGNAISRGNAELEAVLDRSIRYASLPEAIRDTFLWDAEAIVVAGTHGKTTTTSLTAWVLTSGGADPSMLVGGIARNFGAGGASYRVGGGRAFVIEGDEYDSAYFDKTAKFLKYLPDIAVVNNVEFDHADIYPDLAAVRLAFARFVLLVPGRGLVLLGADSPDAAALAPHARCRVQTFGLAEGATWRATGLAPDGEGTRFVVRGPGGVAGEFTVPLRGAHNVRNALAAIAVGHECGLSVASIQSGLATFAGVKRRLELVGERRGVTVY
ncbi:MAG TPA: Mur ligase family protein, partial [Vicinamibacterales bacterium]|nr:Mur ligase family protein [Vicinamibacterales bacterium]